MNTVSRGELSNLRMAAGNETKHPKVILEGVVREWVGIGWIELEPPTDDELISLPIVVD